MALRESKLHLRSRSPGIKLSFCAVVVRILLVLLLLTVALLHLRSAFLAQMALNKNENMAAFESLLKDPDALVMLARAEHLNNAALDKAGKLYKKGLQNFILHVPSWLGLTELFNDSGEVEKAKATLQFAYGFSPKRDDIVWMMAVLADQLNNEQILTESLLWLAANRTGNRQEVFALADLRWPEPEDLLRRFKPESYPDILKYYLRCSESVKAGIVWREMEEKGLVNQEIAHDYINYLIQQNSVAQAGKIWRTYWPAGNSLLFNPAFQEPFIAVPFDWRLTGAEGFSLQGLKTPQGAEVNFDGTRNLQFRLEQVVPLPPGSYRLSGIVETKNLTTDQRPYWIVRSYACDELQVKNTMVPPNSTNSAFAVDFTLPPSCSAVRLILQRDQSFFFDNKIAGMIRLSGLTLLQLDRFADKTTVEERMSDSAEFRPVITKDANEM